MTSIRKSDIGGAQYKDQRTALNPMLHRMFNNMPAPPNPERHERKPFKSKAMRHTDEQVLSAIRRYRRGVPPRTICYDTNCDENVLRAWCQGMNRGHLLLQVEKEEAKAAKR